MSSPQLIASYHAVPNSTPIAGLEVAPFTIPSKKLEAYLDMPSSGLTYSPPPSPTKMSSIPRFESPALLLGTPSLLDESLPSSISSPSLAHTPMPYATTRNPRLDSASFVGLGISGMFKDDGSVFDGMGVLSKRNESCELGFFMDESSQRASGDSDASGYPEQQEDAWRRRMSVTTELFSQYGTHDACSSGTSHAPLAGLWPSSALPLGCSSPAERTRSKNTQPMPAEPDVDDVFFTRSPTLGSSFACQDSNDAFVLDWMQAVQGSK